MKPNLTQANEAPFADSYASVLLDLLRGLAALIVLLEHWRNIFFFDFSQLKSGKGIFLIPYVLSGAGHQSVIVFFVLSGYFIGGTVFRSLERGRWSWSDYLLRRFVRLWIVLIPALLLCAMWDHLGIALGHAYALYHGGATNHMLGNVSESIGVRPFLANLLFLQNIKSPAYGSDGALWSLANEFWYYIIFPLAVLTLRSSVTLRSRVLYGLGFIAVAMFIREGILILFPIWLLGVFLLRMPSLRVSKKTAFQLRIGATLFYLPLFFAISRVRNIPEPYGDYLLGVATFFYLWILLTATSQAPANAYLRISKGLARFSFSLYALHTPLLILLASLLVADSRWLPTPAHVGMASLALLTALGYAYVVASITEFRTDALRLRLEHWLGLRPLAHPLAKRMRK